MLEALHDAYVKALAKENYSSQDYAEYSWKQLSERVQYRYTYEPLDKLAPNPSLVLGYELRADPVARGETGFRSYYASDRSDIRWNDEQRARPNDPLPDIDPLLDLHSYWTKRRR